MCNCSKGRDNLIHPSGKNQNHALHKTIPQTVLQKPTVLFQYIGKTALTIVGNNTRQSYRFHFPGDIQHINSSDAAAMNAIKVLKRI